MTNNWKYIMDTENSCIYVNYKLRKTKIIGIKNIYYYNGIYPNIDFNSRRMFKK